MTRMRSCGEDTPLKAWIRRQNLLDSHLGFVGTDVDLVWYNHLLALLMLMEHKEHLAEVTPSQEATLSVVDQGLLYTLADPKHILISKRLHIPKNVYYCGLHTVVCQNTNPEDGDIYVDGVKLTVDQFIMFLRFEWTPTISVYKSQAERIRCSRTLAELRDTASYIKSTIYSKHPETNLLRKMYREKEQEIKTLDSMFADDEDYTSIYLDPAMQEAENILLARDRYIDGI